MKRLRIGRAADNDLVVQGGYVSRHHALVHFDGTLLWLEDLGSVNGTFVDDQRITGSVEIGWVDEIRLGDVRIDMQAVKEKLGVAGTRGVADPTVVVPESARVSVHANSRYVVIPEERRPFARNPTVSSTPSPKAPAERLAPVCDPSRAVSPDVQRVPPPRTPETLLPQRGTPLPLVPPIAPAQPRTQTPSPSSAPPGKSRRTEYQSPSPSQPLEPSPRAGQVRPVVQPTHTSAPAAVQRAPTPSLDASPAGGAAFVQEPWSTVTDRRAVGMTSAPRTSASPAHSESRQRSRIVAIAAVCLGLAIAGLGVWYALTVRSFQQLAASFDDRYAGLTRVQSELLTPSGSSRSMLKRSKATDYVGASSSALADLEGIRSRVAASSPMKLWLGARRDGALSTMERSIAETRSISDAARTATTATSAVANAAAGVVRETTNARTKAVGALRKESDTSELDEARRQLSSQEMRVRGLMSSVAEQRHGRVSTGLSEGLRGAILADIEAGLETEESALATTRSAVEQASRLLTSYKATLATRLQGGTALLEGLNDLSTRVGPGVAEAYRRTQPVREFLEEADEPLVGGDVAGMLGGMLGGGRRGGGLSALSLAKQMDPTIGMSVDGVEAVCDGIAKVHNEIRSLQQVTGVVLTATRAFQRSRSRADMLAVAASVSRTRSHLEQRTGIFDPVLSEIGKARPYVRTLARVAEQVRVPLGRRLLGSLAEGANDLINRAEAPLLMGKTAIARTAGDLRQIESLETSYERDVAALAAKCPGSR